MKISDLRQYIFLRLLFIISFFALECSILDDVLRVENPIYDSFLYNVPIIGVMLSTISLFPVFILSILEFIVRKIIKKPYVNKTPQSVLDKVSYIFCLILTVILFLIPIYSFMVFFFFPFLPEELFPNSGALASLLNFMALDAELNIMFHLTGGSYY